MTIKDLLQLNEDINKASSVIIKQENKDAEKIKEYANELFKVFPTLFCKENLKIKDFTRNSLELLLKETGSPLVFENLQDPVYLEILDSTLYKTNLNSYALEKYLNNMVFNANTKQLYMLYYSYSAGEVVFKDIFNNIFTRTDSIYSTLTSSSLRKVKTSKLENEVFLEFTKATKIITKSRNNRKIKPEALCKIRSYESMAEQFGVEDGKVKPMFDHYGQAFPTALKSLCGEELTVKEINIKTGFITFESSSTVINNLFHGNEIDSIVIDGTTRVLSRPFRIHETFLERV